MAHDELRLYLVNGVHGDADHDQQRGTAEVEADVEAVGDPGWEPLKESSHQPEIVEMNAADQDLGNQ